MKFTSEDLMKAMGLQVGDKIKCIFMGVLDKGLGNRIFEVHKTSVGNIFLIGEDKGQYPLPILLNRDFEILPRPKRVGDLKCSHDDTSNCRKCPLFVLCHASREYDNKRLYDVLDNWLKSSKDQEIYDLLKARLDKEVQE